MISRKSARDKGTRWNKAIADYLVAEGWPHAEPRAKNGAFDRGDVTGVAGVMIEAKNEARPDLGKYMREVSAQRVNAHATIGAAWIKRPGKSAAADGLVAMHLYTLSLLRTDAMLLREAVSLAAALADAALVPESPAEALLLRRPKGQNTVVAVSGASFVHLLKTGGFQ